MSSATPKEKDGVTYIRENAGPVVTYKMIDLEGGFKTKPFFGMSIDGSAWVRVSRVMEVAIERVEMGFNNSEVST